MSILNSKFSTSYEDPNKEENNKKQEEVNKAVQELKDNMDKVCKPDKNK